MKTIQTSEITVKDKILTIKNPLLAFKTTAYKPKCKKHRCRFKITRKFLKKF